MVVVVLRIGESIMRLEWRTVVKEGEIWGWRLYDFELVRGNEYYYKATVRQLLCKTKHPIKMWLYGVEVGRYKRMFYTEEEAKAWAIAIVRM